MLNANTGMLFGYVHMLFCNVYVLFGNVYVLFGNVHVPFGNVLVLFTNVQMLFANQEMLNTISGLPFGNYNTIKVLLSLAFLYWQTMKVDYQMIRASW